MSFRLKRISRFVNSYDKDLYAKSVKDIITVWRKNSNPAAYEYFDDELNTDQFIIALTDSWSMSGNPVDWGLDPIYWKIMSMDSWHRINMYDEFCRRRERMMENKERARRNENRAIAADLRSEFAKATNDIIVQK